MLSLLEKRPQGYTSSLTGPPALQFQNIENIMVTMITNALRAVASQLVTKHPNTTPEQWVRKIMHFEEEIFTMLDSDSDEEEDLSDLSLDKQEDEDEDEHDDGEYDEKEIEDDDDDDDDDDDNDDDDDDDHNCNEDFNEEYMHHRATKTRKLL